MQHMVCPGRCTALTWNQVINNLDTTNFHPSTPEWIEGYSEVKMKTELNSYTLGWTDIPMFVQ